MKRTLKLSTLLLLLLLAFALLFTACDKNGTDEDDSESQGSESVTLPDGLSAKEWAAMLSESNFENYTLAMQGNMAVLVGGQQVTTQEIDETVKITADKVLITMKAEGVENSIPLEGAIALSQKTQYKQLFLAMLEQFENYTYNNETKTYTLKNAVTIELEMEGLSGNSAGGYETFLIPTKIEMRNAEVTVSENGALVKLVCDYTQTMQSSEESATSVSGITTWSFSDYGTTVIS